MLHWDVELLPEIRGGRSLDRIDVLFTGCGQEKLTKVSDGTGGEAGTTYVDLVQEHHLPERTTGLSLETSASNAGIREPVSGKRRLSRSNFLT